MNETYAPRASAREARRGGATSLTDGPHKGYRGGAHRSVAEGFRVGRV